MELNLFKGWYHPQLKKVDSVEVQCTNCKEFFFFVNIYHILCLQSNIEKPSIILGVFYENFSQIPRVQ